jgi:hypothetical protein
MAAARSAYGHFRTRDLQAIKARACVVEMRKAITPPENLPLLQ